MAFAIHLRNSGLIKLCQTNYEKVKKKITPIIKVSIWINCIQRTNTSPSG
jgi:hypothetical protein